MEVTETSAEGLKREFRIVVPADELEGEITRRLGEIGQAVRIPGFRPGKVPLPLLRKRYGPAVRGEVLESRVQASSAEAMQGRNLRPALPPQVKIVSANEGENLEYEMSVEILPDLPEPDFSALGLERLVADIPEEEIDKAVARIAEQQRKTEAVERPAATGDIVVADTVGRVAGEEIPGTRGEGRRLEIGATGLLPGFTEQLTGVAAGEDRQVTVAFPADYFNPDVAGKEAVFEVKVKEVLERKPPSIDDELAKEMGLETLDELRQEIRGRMQRDYEMVARQRLKRDLLDRLAERYDFTVPPGMVEIEFGTILQQYENEKSRQQEEAAPASEAAPEAATAATAAPVGEAAGEPVAEGGPANEAGDAPSADEPVPAAVSAEEEEKNKAEFRRIAERRVRLGLLLAEVGRSNNINVSQEELNQALVREAQRHPGYERQVIDYYRKNPDAVANLRAPIFEDKVVDFVIELAKPGERKVTPQELMAMPDPETESAAPAEGA